MRLDSTFTLNSLNSDIDSRNNIPFSEYIFNQLGVRVAPIADGRIHRFDIDKKGDNAGWYIYREISNDFYWGECASWKEQEAYTWTSKKRTSEEDKALIRRVQIDYEEERKRIQKEAEAFCDKVYAQLPEASDDYPYFQKKGIKNHDGIARYDKGNDYIVIPCYRYSEKGEIELASLQRIFPDGKKLFFGGTSTKGAFLMIGEGDMNMYLCEGFATGCSIYEATGRSTVIAFNCGNLKNVAEAFSDTGVNFTIVADNDENEAGLKGAIEAGLPYKLIPITGMDANDYKQAGYDLKAFLEPKADEDWLEPIAERRQNRTITTWLIKKWIPEKGLTMIFGAPGSGKSFLIFDMLATITTGLNEWFGYKAKQGTAIYLCGEGHAGLDDRIEAWAQYRGIDDFGSMFISRSALDLDKPMELETAVENIAKTNEKISIIAIDTLNRFFSGDENSAQEARTFVGACTRLQERFDCAVVIIHHTGVAAESQGRARGSSAFLGACDTAILVQNEKGNITLTQVKQKYIEPLAPMYLKLDSRDVKGWIDEDGEQVRSAVLTPSVEPIEEKKLPLDKMMIISEAWRNGNRDYRDEKPYISKDEISEYLTSQDWTPTAIKNALRKDSQYRLMKSLVIAEILKEYGDSGWVVIEPVFASSLMLMG